MSAVLICGHFEPSCFRAWGELQSEMNPHNVSVVPARVETQVSERPITIQEARVPERIELRRWSLFS